LPAIDHSEIEYADFTKNFYEEHDEISNMTPDQMIELRRRLGISVSFALVLLYEIQIQKTCYVFDSHMP